MTVCALNGPLSDCGDELLSKQSSLDTEFRLVNNSGFTLFGRKPCLSSGPSWKRLRNRPFARFQTRNHQELFLRSFWESWIFQMMLFVWRSRCLPVWTDQNVWSVSVCVNPVFFIVCPVVLSRRKKESHTSLIETRVNIWWQNDCFWLYCLFNVRYTLGESCLSESVMVQ